jgi:hypothetical protein
LGTNEQLITAMREAARLLATTSNLCDPDDIRKQIITAALKVVPGVDTGGLAASENGTITTSGPAPRAVQVLDQLQSELHEGPSVSVVDDAPHDGMIVAQDLVGDDAGRWPRFAARAVEAGFRAVLSAQLITTDAPRTEVLNLYANRPHAFDVVTVEIATLFGLQAASVLHCTECATNLERACGTEQASIALAKGILMERFAVDEDEAFHLLVHACQQQNMELADLARSLRGDRLRAMHTTCC